ncbi:hypothetical protein [Ilumatobacter sp.]|uniref:hypothetical protein n=1 Tax=Ilumatobacter sp. TaxID=1967498 RepID=UPI003B516C0F
MPIRWSRLTGSPATTASHAPDSSSSRNAVAARREASALAALRERIEAGDRPGADIVVEGSDTEHSPAAYAAAGATWWMETMWGAMGEHSPVAAAEDRLRRGPPT